ncbi:MAG: hypothetical protein LBJ41_02020 [Treponema sp.]|nr:hypothetical protein [Treponema sp.]
MKGKSSLMRILSMALVFGMLFTAYEFSASGSVDMGGKTVMIPRLIMDLFDNL